MIPVEKIEIGFENIALCSKCAGACCKKMPGSNFPEDFELPGGKKLREALKSGKYAIDWWEGDPRDNKNDLSQAYFIRPATKGAEGKMSDASWGGECTFLTGNGCTLTLENRPRECRMLEAKEGNGRNCLMNKGNNKKDAAIAWIKYTEIIEKILGD